MSFNIDAMIGFGFVSDVPFGDKRQALFYKLQEDPRYDSIEFDTHGTDDRPIPFICFRNSFHLTTDDRVKTFTPTQYTEEEILFIKEVAHLLDMHQQEPYWFLAQYYGC